jgi:hypothetical protein
MPCFQGVCALLSDVLNLDPGPSPPSHEARVGLLVLGSVRQPDIFTHCGLHDEVVQLPLLPRPLLRRLLLTVQRPGHALTHAQHHTREEVQQRVAVLTQQAQVEVCKAVPTVEGLKEDQHGDDAQKLTEEGTGVEVREESARDRLSVRVSVSAVVRTMKVSACTRS